LGLEDYQKGDVIHWQAEENLTEQFKKRGKTGHKCNPYDVSEGPIRARRIQPDEVSVHNRSPDSLVVCQLRNAEWKKQGKSVIMMIPALQLKVTPNLRGCLPVSSGKKFVCTPF